MIYFVCGAGFPWKQRTCEFFSGGHSRRSSDDLWINVYLFYFSYDPTQLDNSFCFPVSILNFVSAKMKTLPKCDPCPCLDIITARKYLWRLVQLVHAQWRDSIIFYPVYLTLFAVVSMQTRNMSGVFTQRENEETETEGSSKSISGFPKTAGGRFRLSPHDTIDEAN